MVLQVLAWMWCIIFSMWVGSFWIMGASMIAHAFILAAIVVTVATFEIETQSKFLQSVSYIDTKSFRQYMWVNGKKIKLDPQDKGGEHE